MFLHSLANVVNLRSDFVFFLEFFISAVNFCWVGRKVE